MIYNYFHPFIVGVVLAFGLILPLGPQNMFILSQGATQSKLRRALPAFITAGCDTAMIIIAITGTAASW